MTISEDQLISLISINENENREYKEAKEGYSFDDLVNYCAALANEKGGKFFLGITNKCPRKIIGTRAFINLEETKFKLLQKLHFRVDIQELCINELRALIFEIPSRPRGRPVMVNNTYWMRSGESLVAMTPEHLLKIFEEEEPDFTASICPEATIEDLNSHLILKFKDLWIKKSGNLNLKNLSDLMLLKDAELIIDNKITYAALILFGTRFALGKYLPQAETIFEYRSSYVTGPAQQRIEYREGFFQFNNDLWDKINLRNDIQHFQDGLYVWDTGSFD